MIIDYIDDFPDCLLAQGKGNLFVSVYELEGTIKRIDGIEGTHAVHVKYLSQNCENENDESWACVSGDDREIFTLDELIESGFLDKNENPLSCFSENVLY